MNILIAGAGKGGVRLTRQLAAEGHAVTVIDRDSATLNACLEQYDVMAVRGNCASAAVLEEAGVREADLLITSTGSDEVNLLSCITARHINQNLHTIARICNPEYTNQLFAMKEAFGLSMAVNPEKQAAVEIERLLKYPGFLKRDTFAKGRMEIVELQVTHGSKLCDVPLSDLVGIVKCRVLVCAVLRDGKALIPDGSFVLRENDCVFVTASTDNLTTLLRNLGIITHKAKRVMLAGGGRVSFYLAQELQKAGVSVRIIERDLDRCTELAGLLPAAEVIHGDATDHHLLQIEGLQDFDAFVSMTGLDELNMVLSLYAARQGVPQTITKLGRIDTGDLQSTLPLGSVVSPKDIYAGTIVRYVRALQNQTGAAVSVHPIANGQIEAAEFVVDDTTLHLGEPLKDIKLRRGVLVAGISRAGKTEIAGGNSVFQKGDSLVLVSGGDHVIYRLNDIFE